MKLGAECGLLTNRGFKRSALARSILPMNLPITMVEEKDNGIIWQTLFYPYTILYIIIIHFSSLFVFYMYVCIIISFLFVLKNI